MNGRCESDPLDRAVDVCNRCYGEYCENHLVFPKGRKHPFCAECAIAASGVRGSAKPELRGDRKTAKKRRAALKQAPAVEEEVFSYFDTEQPVVADADEDVVIVHDEVDKDFEPLEERLPPAGDGEAHDESIAGEPLDEAAAGAGSAEDAPRPIGAVAQLEMLRQGADAGRPPPPTAEDGAGADDVDDVDDVDDLTPRRKRPSLLERLNNNPPPAVPPSPPRQASPPVSAEVEELPSQETRRDDLPPTPDSGIPEPVEPVTIADRKPVPPPAHRRPTAPNIGVAQSQHDGRQRRSTDDGAQRSDRTEPSATGLPTRRSATGADQDERRADVDEKGNWVPPILRGITAEAREAKSDLPRRGK